MYPTNLRYCLFFSVEQQPNSELGRLIVEVSGSHSDTYTTGRTPLDEWSARHRNHYL